MTATTEYLNKPLRDEAEAKAQHEALWEAANRHVIAERKLFAAASRRAANLTDDERAGLEIEITLLSREYADACTALWKATAPKGPQQ